MHDLPSADRGIGMTVGTTSSQHYLGAADRSLRHLRPRISLRCRADGVQQCLFPTSIIVHLCTVNKHIWPARKRMLPFSTPLTISTSVRFTLSLTDKAAGACQDSAHSITPQSWPIALLSAFLELLDAKGRLT